MSPKECLKNILIKLAVAEFNLETIMSANHNINSCDYGVIGTKKDAISQIFKYSMNQVQQKTTHKFIYHNRIVQKTSSIRQIINTLNDTQCSEILLKIQINLKLTLADNNASETSETWLINDGANNNSVLSADDMREAFKTHTIDNTWYFTFIAKIIMLIQKTLGLKTSEEIMLEKVIEDIKDIEDTKSPSHGP